MTWLIVLVGLVGSGKTRFASELRQRLPCVIVSNDRVRQELFPRPRYDPTEVKTVHDIAMNRIRQLLTAGQHVVYDGTNLTRSGRHELRMRVGDLAHVLPIV